MIILRPGRFPFAFCCCLSLFSGVATAQDGGDGSSSFDCSNVNVDGASFDLTTLAGEHTISRERNTPPSTFVDTLRFNLCEDLKPEEGKPEGDQCPSGTRACLIKTNKKNGESDRIVATIPIAQTSSLKPEYSIIGEPGGLSLTLHGGSYPSDASSSDSLSQSLYITLFCNSQQAEPTFVSYGSGRLELTWDHPAGCKHSSDEAPQDDEKVNPPDGGEKEESMGSGIGWFFLVLIIALVSYFGLGAYYNYSTYGATGADLIPHRDFWREVPYMFQDVISHLCSAVRPKHSSSRGGYIAV